MGRKSRLKKQRRQLLEQTLFDFIYTKYLEFGRGLTHIGIREKSLEYMALATIEQIPKNRLDESTKQLIQLLNDYKPEEEFVIITNLRNTGDDDDSVIVFKKDSELATTKVCDLFSHLMTNI